MLIVRGRVSEGRILDSDLDFDFEGDLGMFIRFYFLF